MPTAKEVVWDMVALRPQFISGVALAVNENCRMDVDPVRGRRICLVEGAH